MAGSPPVDPPDTGASGLGGGNVDPEHALIYTGKWPFGDPNNPRPDSDSPGVTELGVNTSAVGEGSIYDNMFPFKLQWFIDDDPESETFRQRRLRIYTGMLTAMINTFTYYKSKDTDTTYSGSLNVEEYTGMICGTPPDTESNSTTLITGASGSHTCPSHTIIEMATDTTVVTIDNNTAPLVTEDNTAPLVTQDNTAPLVTQENSTALSTSDETVPGDYSGTTHSHTIDSHTHSISAHNHSISSHNHSISAHNHTSPSHHHMVPEHYVPEHSHGDHTHTIPSHHHQMGDHRHYTKGGSTAEERASASEMVTLSVSKTRCDIEKFLTVDGQPAIQGPLQIEPDGFVDMTRINVDGVEVPTGFRAQTLGHAYGDVYLTWDLDTDKDKLGGAADGVVTNVNIAMINPNTTDAGQLTRTDWAASRDPDIGSYKLLIGTAFDPDSEDEQEASKGIVQVIYENVYYSPLILPEIEDTSGSPSCDSTVTESWN